MNKTDKKEAIEILHSGFFKWSTQGRTSKECLADALNELLKHYKITKSNDEVTK